jgi:hypothetical protein
MHVEQILATHPQLRGEIDDAVIRCIEHCYDCAQTCIACADACLAEELVHELAHCIRLNLDCADVCQTTGAVMTRRMAANEALSLRMLEACAEACRICGEECARHAVRHEHCRVCGEACAECGEACVDAMEDVRAVGQ